MGDKRIFIPQDTGLTNTENFDIVTYTGNNNTQSITSLDFQPDLIWFKSRSAARSNALVDSVRGNRNIVWSDLTSQAYDSDVGDDLTSFNSDGFTVGPVDNAGSINALNDSIVAWCFKGGGTAVSNTTGSITSTVSANPDAGFSIVKWTGTEANATIGHGLSSAPRLIIIKNASEVKNWTVYAQPAGATHYAKLNLADEFQDADTAFNDTHPTSSVFSVGSASVANGSDDTMIAYCFADVDSYQKVGTYSGATSAQTITGVGFRPRFLLIKAYAVANSGSMSWLLYDSLRDGTYRDYLRPNSSDEEAESQNNDLDFNDDGWKFNMSNTGINTNGQSYIYLAIA
jgi:hypothetical protein